MTKYHDVLVKPRHFNIRDLVLKRVSLATKDLARGKLRPNLGRTVQSYQFQKARFILFGGLRWMEVRALMERAAFEEILPVKVTCQEG